MSLGTWDPDADAAAHDAGIETAVLSRFIQIARDEMLPQLADMLLEDEQQIYAGMMQLEADDWLAAAANLNDDEVLQLLRFFAVAENLPGWEAGPKSPVIPLAKTLRKRGVRLDKIQLQWLRDVNKNRFLPYGPL